MKNRNINAVVGMLLAGLFLASISCEGPVGPQGPTGLQGEQGQQGLTGASGADGADGNANVISSEWITNTWFRGGNNIVSDTLFAQEITAEILDRG